MPLLLRAASLAFCLTFLHTTGVGSGFMPAQQAPVAPAASGKDILTRKCFQCHQASMWTSVRGDRREWLGVLYRMVGRGALWTEEEINAMADFLAETRPQK